MIVTNKAIARRTMLRGFGATLALPLLDAMVPALTALAATPAQPVRRLGLIYVAHGAVMDNWTPAAEGTGFPMSPILEPLTPFRDRLLVLTGLYNIPGQIREGEPVGNHGRVGGSFLSGVHVKPTEGRDFRAGITIDQIVAEQFGQQTQLRSLELTLEPSDLAGSCDVGFSCAYTNTLCWRGPTTPLPMENNPRVVFERMFGDAGSTDSAARMALMRKDASILDSLIQSVGRLKGAVGSSDRAKLTEYFEAIRDIERRIQNAEAQSDRELPVVNEPMGIPATFDEHAKLMIDLQVLAYQTDLTRVITFMISRELSARSYPEIGVPEPHHQLSHHQNNPESLKKLTLLQTYYAQLLAYYLEKLRATPDGDGSLLDHVALLYGSGISDSNSHDTHNIPILVVGGGAGQIKGGRHIRYLDEPVPSNLYVGLLRKVGVEVDHVGNSTGELAF